MDYEYLLWWPTRYGTGWITLAIWWTLLVFIIAAIGRWIATRKPPPERSALEILNLRYARGEISQAEYREKQEDILAASQAEKDHTAAKTGREVTRP